MGTPELGLCLTCRAIAKNRLEEVQHLKRPLHQVDPELQAWLYAGEHLTALKHRHQSEHLFAAVETLEGRLLRALPEPRDSQEAADQVAQLVLLRVGWTL